MSVAYDCTVRLYAMWPVAYHYTKCGVQFIELAYHFLRCKTTQQTYSLYAVYPNLHSKLPIYNFFLFFLNFFTISFKV